MPWDGTTLWESAAGGTPRLVAGGSDESITQPSYSPSGVLHWMSDRTGWWNLYADDGAAGAPVMVRDADLAGPDWVFGNSTYAFLPDGQVVVAWSDAGAARLTVVGGDATTDVATPYTQLSGVRATDTGVITVAGSPLEPTAVVEIGVPDGRVSVLAVSRGTGVGAGYLSAPRPIEFPTVGGLTAHAWYYPPANPDFAGPDTERPPLVVMSHGGPDVCGAVDAQLRHPVLDQPRDRGRRRRLRRQRRVRPRLPPAPRRAVGDRRRGRLRQRGALVGRAGRGRRRSPGHPRRERGRIHDAVRLDVPRRVRRRCQPLRSRRRGHPGGRDAQVRVALPRPPDRTVARGQSGLRRALADLPHRGPADTAHHVPGPRGPHRPAQPGRDDGRRAAAPKVCPTRWCSTRASSTGSARPRPSPGPRRPSWPSTAACSGSRPPALPSTSTSSTARRCPLSRRGRRRSGGAAGRGRSHRRRGDAAASSARTPVT